MVKAKSKARPVKSLSQSKIERLENGNIEVVITILWKTISQGYDKTLAKLAKSAKIKGFRPGKAPKELAEKSIGKEKIYQELIKVLLTDVYLEAVKTHKLLPVVSPKLNLISSEERKDWQLKAITAELPKFELGSYKSEVKKALAPEKIWLPGEDKETDKKKEESQEKKLQEIFGVLLKVIKIKIPPILIENEVNRMLSRLVDQTARLGLTVEQYLGSINKTGDQLRSEYQKQAEESISLELILSSIANQEEIKVSEEEVEKMIQVTGDEKLQKSLQTPAQKAYIRQILRKRRVIDMLLKL